MAIWTAGTCHRFLLMTIPTCLRSLFRWQARIQKERCDKSPRSKTLVLGDSGSNLYHFLNGRSRGQMSSELSENHE